MASAPPPSHDSTRLRTARPGPASPSVPPPVDGGTDGAVAIRGPLRRLLALLPSATLVIGLVWGAVPSVMLALQVQRSLGEADKIANLAIITTIGGIVSVLAQPIAGALSDRTRSRFGKRTPWIVLGSLVGGLSLVGMSFADNLAQFTIGWVCIILGFNFAQGPLSAVLPDRVPRAVRGTFAAFVGLGTMFGSLGGQIFGASMSSNIPLGYLLLAGIAVIGTTLFVVFAREGSSLREPASRFSLRTFLGSFWVNPIRFPNFAWAFASRLLLYTGYNIVFGYKLYVLQDYVGLGEDAITVLPLMGIVAILGLLTTTVLAGRLSDRIGRRKIFVVISALVVAAALLIPLFLPTTLGILLMAGIGGMGYGCFQAVDTALISEVLPAQSSYAKDLGVVNMAASLPQILAPSAAGLIVIVTGGYAALFPVGALCAVLAGLVVTRVRSVQ